MSEIGRRLSTDLAPDKLDGMLQIFPRPPDLFVRTTVLAILFACSTATEAGAAVASISFDELVQGSDIIVVAKVESVSNPLIALIGKRYAKARVMDVWKGAQMEQVEFRASPTWTCDTSGAIKGETVLLFLKKGDESRSYAIMRSGAGRVPIRTVDGKSYATIQSDILQLPKDTPTIDGPEPQYDFMRSVEVDTLRNLVRKAFQKKEQQE